MTFMGPRDPRLRRKVSDGPFRPAANILTIPDHGSHLARHSSVHLALTLYPFEILDAYPSIVLQDKQDCDLQQAIVRIKLL